MKFNTLQKKIRRRHIFSELIVRLLAYFMGILILYSTAQIVVERVLINKIRQQNAIVANQRTKRELGSIIKEKITLLELYFQKSLLSSNRHARNNLFHQAYQEMDSMEKLLPILQNGGTFTHSIVVNLNTADEVLEEISYSKEHSDKNFDNTLVEVIAILPKIKELKDLLTTIRTTQVFMERAKELKDWSVERTERFQNTLQQYLFESDTLLLRCRENSNKIFFDTTNELKKLLIERERLLSQFNTIRQYFYVIFQVVITVMFLLIFIKINRILKDATVAEEENRKLLSAIKQSPLSVVITDRNSCIEYVNPAFETITGHARNEVIGQKSSIFNSGLQDTAFYKEMWDTLLSGRIWQNELQSRRKSGELFWERATIIPVTDSRQETTHYVAIKEDMTEKINLLKSYEESNEIFEKIFANMPVGIVLISSKKELMQMNNEAERILGYKPGEGDAFLKGEICHGNYCTLPVDQCPIYDLKKPKVVLNDRDAIKKDGSRIPILKSVMPIKLNEYVSIEKGRAGHRGCKNSC